MKVSSSISPLAFTLETNPRRPNFRLARFHENAIETESGWEYDEYCLEFPTSDTLEAEIEAHYGEYLKQAMEAGGASEAEYISVARNAALERISGKCSAAIYAGMDVTPSTTRGKHHYSFPKLAQDDINQMMTSIAVSGETVFSYKADDESLNLYTVDEIKVISKSLKILGTVCTKYKEELEAWIARETDKVILASIDFGVKLPDDLTTSLSGYLTSLGIDATAFMSMLV
jgi:hypothetical protein